MDLVRPTLLSSKPNAPWEIQRREKLTYPPERVWKALTEPADLKRWFCDEASIDGRVGGCLEFSGKTVFRTADSTTDSAASSCEILAFDPPHELAFRWSIGGVDTTVRYDLESHLEQTNLTVTQSGERSPDETIAADEPNWWWLALSTLRTYLEDGRADLRLDYDRLLEDSPLRFEVEATTFPWVVWTKLTDAKELRRWWNAVAEIELSSGGAFEFAELADAAPRPTQIIEAVEGERLVYGWAWSSTDTSEVSWEIEETDEDTLVRVQDHGTPPSPAERLRRCIHWASRLLYLVQLSEKGTSPLEYQDPFQPQRPPGF